ncbi:MAG: DUF86 domain-containing protein [Candidatus Saganbacteria bacterium]|nr:DUF86 domain-containing protein [Candidatus Saganbacteria bacterium]
MVNPEKIEGLLEKLREYVSQLNELKKLPKEELTGQFTNLNSAKYLFQVAIECCLDIGNHIISSEGFRSPADYKDILRVLNENKIIPDEFLDTAISMAKFRNRLVHLYWEVDKDKVYDFLQNDLGYFDKFIRHILKFLP